MLFIDEIHRIPKAVEEYMYTAMENFRINLIFGEGINARTHNFKLRPFTLIGATTRAGMLTGPLRDRFQIREHLDFYALEDTTEDRSPQRKKAGRQDYRRSGNGNRRSQSQHAAGGQQPFAFWGRDCVVPALAGRNNKLAVPPIRR